MPIERKHFTVNAAPFDLSKGGKEWTSTFNDKLHAEVYIRALKAMTDYIVLEYNFVSEYSEEELASFVSAMKKRAAEAKKLQNICSDITHANWMRPDLVPCEVCGANHENWNCCDRCNLSEHRCHFCGDHLGHGEVSACYIMEVWND